LVGQSPDAQGDCPRVGELEGVRQQVSQYLRKTLLVCQHRRGKRRIGIDLEAQTLVGGDRVERAADVRLHVGEAEEVREDLHLPASIFERSRMSLISCNRSAPAVWIVRANSSCLSLRLRGSFSSRSLERINRLLSGVR